MWCCAAQYHACRQTVSFVQVQHMRLMGACIDLGLPSVNFMRLCQEAVEDLRREELFGHMQAFSL